MNRIEIASVKFQNTLHRIFPGKAENKFTSAIVTAGGSGTRLGGTPKQLRNLAGKPCILHTLLAFQNCKEVDEIIVVIREDQENDLRFLCKEHNITKLSCVVYGGASRQESVSNGFEAISKKANLVAIHDAARPLILPEQITYLLQQANRYGAATAAKKASDTIKRADKNAFITETVPRDDLYQVQTPQVFKADLYRVAVALAAKDQFTATDDCSLAEHAGFSVKLCELNGPNIKLTTEEDLLTISAILKERQNG